MKKELHEEKEDINRTPNEKLAAAYNILRELSDDEFESWVRGSNVSPTEYAEAERAFLSQPISEKIADLKRRVALGNTPKSEAPAEWLQNTLKEFGARADRFCRGFVSRVVELVQVPDSGFVRTAPVLSHASGDTLPTKTVRLDDFVPDAVLKEHLPWAGDFLRVTATKVEPASADNAFRVAVDVREGIQDAKGELAIGIKFKSQSDLVVLSRKQASTVLKYRGPEQLGDLSIQVFTSTAV